jgi:hypothetical protein
MIFTRRSAACVPVACVKRRRRAAPGSAPASASGLGGPGRREPTHAQLSRINHTYLRPALCDVLALKAAPVFLRRDPARIPPAHAAEQVIQSARSHDLQLIVNLQSQPDGCGRLRPRSHSIGSRGQRLHRDTETRLIPQVHGGLVLDIPSHVRTTGPQYRLGCLIPRGRQVAGVEECDVNVLDLRWIEASMHSIPDQITQCSPAHEPVRKSRRTHRRKYPHHPRRPANQLLKLLR